MVCVSVALPVRMYDTEYKGYKHGVCECSVVWPYL